MADLRRTRKSGTSRLGSTLQMQCTGEKLWLKQKKKKHIFQFKNFNKRKRKCLQQIINYCNSLCFKSNEHFPLWAKLYCWSYSCHTWYCRCELLENGKLEMPAEGAGEWVVGLAAPVASCMLKCRMSDMMKIMEQKMSLAMLRVHVICMWLWADTQPHRIYDPLVTGMAIIYNLHPSTHVPPILPPPTTYYP